MKNFEDWKKLNENSLYKIAKETNKDIMKNYESKLDLLSKFSENIEKDWSDFSRVYRSLIFKDLVPDLIMKYILTGKTVPSEKASQVIGKLISIINNIQPELDKNGPFVHAMGMGTFTIWNRYVPLHSGDAIKAAKSAYVSNNSFQIFIHEVGREKKFPVGITFSTFKEDKGGFMANWSVK